MSLFTFPFDLWNRISKSVEEMRQQAPAARMVGEFAVKHVANEAQKKMTGFSQTSDTVPPAE